MTTATPSPVQLTYGSRPPWRRRRVARRIVASLLIGALAFLSWKFGPHISRFVCDRYWYRQCVNFTAAPDIAVYEELPHGTPRPHIEPPYVDGDDPRVRALMTPYLGSSQARAAPPVFVVRVPSCMVSLRIPFKYTLPPEPSACIVFCDGRTSGGGHHRLVYVAPSSFIDIGDLLVDSMSPTTCDTPDWSGLHPHDPQGRAIQWTGQALPFPRRIFAGQPDPSDASHFTIEYEWPDATRGIIEGWLLDDDRVKLKIRPGPGDISSARESMRQHPELWEQH